jgi:hypothetical protein
VGPASLPAQFYARHRGLWQAQGHAAQSWLTARRTVAQRALATPPVSRAGKSFNM